MVPWFSQWKGHAIFLDGDMIVQDDIANLWALRDPYKAVQVVKHDYKTKHPVKYLGSRNDDYPRKNWSSVILWNNNHFHNRDLTPEFVSEKTGSFLHQFKWLSDDLIGELPSKWNHLVLEYPDKTASLYHYTVGAPCFSDYKDLDRGQDWYKEFHEAINPIL